MAHKIYLSASTQENNKGVGNYGTEEQRMFILRDLTEQLIKNGNEGNKFDIKKNSNKSSSLTAIVNASNNFKADTHWAFHTNAGGGRGCEVYYSYLNTTNKGKKAATLWYNEISPITPTSDRGVKKDNTVYSNGFYELRSTTAIAVLCEFIFHDNLNDVNYFLANISKFALGTAKAIYKYYGYTYKSKNDVKDDIKKYDGILKIAYDNGWFTGKDYKESTNVDFGKLCWILKQYEENYLNKLYKKK